MRIRYYLERFTLGYISTTTVLLPPLLDRPETWSINNSAAGTVSISGPVDSMFITPFTMTSGNLAVGRLCLGPLPLKASAAPDRRRGRYTYGVKRYHRKYYRRAVCNRGHNL